MFITALTSLCLLAVSCEKGKDGPEKPEGKGLELIADKTEISADGFDMVKFTVFLDGEDITSEMGVSVCLSSGSSGMCLIPFGGEITFSTDTPGEYVFTASYREYESPSVKITAVQAGSEGPDVPGKEDPEAFDPSREIHKNVFFNNFTATWCATCYGKYKSPMAEYLQEKEHADHIVQMDVHVQDEIGDTQLSYELMEDVGADGRWETINTLPRIFVDFRREFTGVSEDWIYCMGFPAVTAIKVQSSYGGGSVSVDVSMGVKDAGDYRIVAALVEDGIVGYQKGYGENGEGYTHNNVLRSISSGGLFGGENITVAAGEEVQRAFTLGVSENCNVSNLFVVVYSLRYEDGVIIADNAVKVPVGDFLDYRYK